LLEHNGIFRHLLYEEQDEAALTREIALCLHGEPTWGYLFRTLWPR
jgi:hypothetical protein